MSAKEFQVFKGPGWFLSQLVPKKHDAFDEKSTHSDANQIELR